MPRRASLNIFKAYNEKGNAYTVSLTPVCSVTMKTINYMKVEKFKGKPVYTRRVVDYVTSLSYEDLPNDVVRVAKTVVLNLLGCALAGSKYEHSRAIVNYVHKRGGNQESSVLRSNFKTSADNAAFANGSMPYILDLNGHRADLGVWPALAVGEKVKASGKDFITAIVAGCDIHRRLINAMKIRSLYNRRFHHAGVCGCFNGAVAAGKILGLDKDEFTNALGLAGMLASGIMAWLTDPTEMSRALSPGLGARNGTTAALLAKEGYAGPPAIFEGDWNVFDAFSGDYNREELTKDLGKVFAWKTESILFSTMFKRHAACGCQHEALDALLKMMQERNIRPENMKEIKVRLAPSRVPIVNDNAIRSHMIQYTMAVAAFDKEITPENMLKEDRLKDPKLLKLSKHVNVVSDPELSGTSTIVEVLTKDGAKYVERLDRTICHLSTKEDVEQKFMNLATTAISARRAKRIMKLIKELEKIEDIGKLGDLLRMK